MRVQYKNFTSTRNFGVELEVGNEFSRSFISTLIKNDTNMKVNVSNYTQSVNNSHWVVKTDASCGRKIASNGINEGGYEVASFVASGIKDIEKISRVAALMKRRGIRANNNCGFHLHVDASDFSEELMGKLISYWVLIEDIIFSMVPFRRTVNRYCKKVKTKNKSFDLSLKTLKDSKKVWEIFKPKTINIRHPNEKRFSLNLLNFYAACKTKFKRKTIEFRFPEGTLCQYTIKNFIIMLLSFVENMKVINVPNSKNVTVNNFLNICGLSDSNCLLILESDLIKAKIWILKRIIRFSKSTEFTNQARKILAKIYKGYGNAKSF